ncbi:MAG: phosphoribosylpyrophosphate synthetase [Saprospiraceae bacterium]|nr:phosphoribosylpyrophosphate synthetase [Saprospiraceae bacterium]
MQQNNYDTLSQAVNALTANGYKEGFKAAENKIIATNSSKEYKPEELKIIKRYRFDGMTNPQDDTMVLALEAKDGLKGTLVMSYSSKHFQNVELIKKIPRANN